MGVEEIQSDFYDRVKKRRILKEFIMKRRFKASKSKKRIHFSPFSDCVDTALDGSRRSEMRSHLTTADVRCIAITCHCRSGGFGERLTVGRTRNGISVLGSQRKSNVQLILLCR